MSKLTYLSAKALDELYKGIPENIDRYREGDFDDLRAQAGWAIPLDMKVDFDRLAELDPGREPAAEVHNSLTVWRALHELTPALACEDRIWTRLSHVECLTYSRKRWIEEKHDNDGVANTVRKHFFAPTRTGCRDDHAISRLWWNARIAKNIRPDDQEGALNLMLKKSDVRLSFVERSEFSSRQSLASAILRIIEREPATTESQRNFRNFMKVVNRLGGGMVFEALSDKKLDAFVDECLLTSLVEAEQA